ncbi:MAG: GTPase HflX [Atopobiaceae bacterium]|nr:GTPase HflX [Atopobiaceae bacterium]
MARFEPKPTESPRERVFVVGIDRPGSEWTVEDSLAELTRLVQTADGDVVGSYVQRLTRPVPKTYIGSGKAHEIADDAVAGEVDVVVFDDELSPSQQANLERIMGEGIKVIDRTALILDIFARHATTREGRLQVQLAQNQYLLPRLRGMWSHLVREQTRGGIGSRFGQGESQLEVDRRLVRKRITTLKRELERLEHRRGEQSKVRSGGGVFRVALVGYTNAGKSTLLNVLAGADAYVQDELFATLDPTTRSVTLQDGHKATITDTVGFIQKLPTTLVESFKSTLYEARSADLLLLVADASDKNVREEIATVQMILDDIGASDAPCVLVFNKCDLLGEDEIARLRDWQPDAELVSAVTGSGMGSLGLRVAREAMQGEQTMTVLIPFDKGSFVRAAHERSHVVHEEYVEEGTLITLRADARMRAELEAFRIG